MELIVIMSIGLAAMFFALWPVMRGEVGQTGFLAFSSNGEREDLLREKEEAVGAVKEIEFDYVSGKLSSEDYSRLNSSYENRVIKLLKELDEYDADDSLSQALEEQIDAVRKNRGARGCPKCGNPVAAGYKFCPACGIEADHQGMGRGK